MMRTLFLQAPSFDGFDGGAGSRYQARREIRSFWYPTWLAQPAALVVALVRHEEELHTLEPEVGARQFEAVFVGRVDDRIRQELAYPLEVTDEELAL